MRGHILDLYPGKPGEMVVWFKLENGDAVRLVDRWSPSIFIGTDTKSDFAVPLQTLRDEFEWTRVVRRQERISVPGESEVIEAKLRDARRAVQVAGRIERLGPFGTFRLYNIDIPPNQSYLYDHDLFPLAYCEVERDKDRLRWKLKDDVWEYEYEIPKLRKTKLDVQIDQKGRLPRFTDRITSITLEGSSGKTAIEGRSEADKLRELMRAIREADPDFILTNDGDTFLFPYLIKRSEANGLALTLDRDATVMKLPSKAGTSYFSYGQIHYKPSAMKLYGRLHIDVNTSFAYSEAGFEGLFELSRICRMPLQTSSRATIGKALSSLQCYHASKMGLLVPWKPTLWEHFKDRNELLLADRGGFIFEPRIGVHEGVGELDFSALFPNIMLRKNISAETIKCSCCPDSTNRVPELGWNVCEKKMGLVAKSMEIVVGKRLRYKELKSNATEDARRIYDERQAALKWIGVVCLPRESPVFVTQDGIEKFVRIGDFIDGIAGKRTGVMGCPSDVYVAGIGPDYKAKYVRVANLIKKPNRQNLLSIDLEDGRKIVATPDHPFFILREGELKVITASELEAGEALPVAKRIPSLHRTTDRIDLIGSLEKKLSNEEQRLWRVSGECLKEEIRTKRKSILKGAISEGYSSSAVASWIKNGIIPIRFLRLLDVAPELHRGLRIGAGRRGGGRIAWLPAVIEIDEGLGFFLGLFVSDGSGTKTYVRLDIASSEPELLETAKKLVESLFGISPRIYKEKRAQMYVVQINSASLVRILEKVFGLPGSSEKGKLRVPDVIFNCRQSVAHRFIAGLVAGDGHASKERRYVDIVTASKGLQEQIAFLAAKLGLTYRLNKDRAALYTIDFVGPETLGSIGSWEYSKENQKARIMSWSKESPYTCTHARYTRLPAAESGLFTLAKTTRTSSEPHVLEGSRTCPTQVEKKLGRMSSRKLSGDQTRQISRIDRLLHGDLGFVRVRKITRLDSRPEYVYCFQLADDEVPGFFTGEGLVFTHNCFGYLGHSNAKFGRIDAHISVCAWDRKILIDTTRIAERRGFKVLHGIVDSLWLQKEGAGDEDYLDLKAKIEEETGFAISFEGIYKWVVFLPSKVEPGIPVLNRYFGVYRDGELKVRGIEARRHDTPLAFSRCQMEILRTLAEADSVAEAKAKVPACVEIFLRHAESLARHEVPAPELAFTTNLSKGPEEYTTMTVQHAAIKQLVGEGATLHAGEGIRYVITDYRGKDSKRATPADVIQDETKYDSERYIELLAETCASVLEPFDPRCTGSGLQAAYEARRSGTLS
ncbi:MAG TPA: DNA polymerase domain-containing protein [Nitrososphaerales archaeon]|nr:DNA polymerase domain-containing protein [Nitrososphaerales archaeon]